MTALPWVPFDYDHGDPGDPVVLERLFLTLNGAVADLDREAAAHLEQNDDAAAAVLLLFDLREARKALAEVEASVEATAAQRMRGPTLDLPGYVVERKGGLDRKHWRSDELAWEVCREFTVDTTTGEVSQERAALVAAVRDRLLNCASVSGWRVTQLRPLGLDPSEWCESTPGRRTVHVRKAVEDA